MDEDVKILLELDVQIDNVKNKINQLQKYISKVDNKPASLVSQAELKRVEAAKRELKNLSEILDTLQTNRDSKQAIVNKKQLEELLKQPVEMIDKDTAIARINEIEAELERARKVYDEWGEERMPLFFGKDWENKIANYISELSNLSVIANQGENTPLLRVFEAPATTVDDVNEVTNALEQATEASENLSNTLSDVNDVTEQMANNTGDFVETIEEIPTEPSNKVLDTLTGVTEVLQTIQDKTMRVFTLIGGVGNAMIGKIRSALSDIGGKYINLVTGELPNGTSRLSTLFSLLGNTIKHTFSNLKQHANPAIKSIKRIGLAMLGVRSTFTAIRKAMNAYMEQNEESAARLQSIWVAIGNAIGPVVEYIIDIITKAFGYINSFVKSLTGIDMVANANAKAIDNQAKSTKNLAKEQRRQLAAFDEMNRLNEETSGSGSDSKGPTLIEVPDFDFGEGGIGAGLADRLNKIFAEIDWDAIRELLTKGVMTLVNDMNGFIATLDFKSLGETIAKGISLIPQALNTFWKNFNFKEAGRAFIESLQGFFENIDWASLIENWVLKRIAKINFLAGAIESFDLRGLITKIGESLQKVDWTDLITQFGQALGSLIGAIISQGLNIAILLGQLIVNVWNAITGYFGEYIAKAKEEFPDNWFGLAGNIIDGLLMGIIDALSGIWNWIKEHIFKPFIEGFKAAFGIGSPSKVMEEQGNFIIEGLYNGLVGIWEAVKGIFEDLVLNILRKFSELLFGENNFLSDALTDWDTFKANLAQVVTGLKDKLIEKWEALKLGIAEKWEAIKQSAKDAWQSIKDTFSPVTSWFSEKFGTAWAKVKEIFADDNGAFTFDSISEGIKNVFKDIVNNLISGLNRVIAWPFNKINSILNYIKGIEILGFKPFNSLWGWSPISVPQIPKLAQGAVIPPNKEFMAILGDQKSGMNIEAPLDTIVDAFRQVLAENNGQALELTVKLDGKTLSRELTKATKKLDFSYNRG